MLCEDRQHYAFVHHFLKKMANPRMRESRLVLGPGHAGVRAQLANEVASIRKQGARAGLLVVVDADGHSVEARRRYLTELCPADEMPTPADPVALLVPERNIETWIHWLSGHAVDDSTRYPKLRRERDCRPAVGALKAACDSGVLAPETPDSLQDACREFRRVVTILER
ncbi:MAG: hypothetical protein IPM29_30775 [Planctomycetes bacterium]|nr:hypothetical protein [Planctomycetota bacterium]